MMIESKIISFLKSLLTATQTKSLFAILLFCTSFIFMPDNWAKALGLFIVRIEYKIWFGVAILATGCVMIVRIYSYFREKYDIRRHKKATISRLSSLSEKERELLLRCVFKQEQSIVSTITDGNLQSLVGKEILTTHIGNCSMMAFPFYIPDYIWKYLNKNKQKYFPELSDAKRIKELKKKWGA